VALKQQIDPVDAHPDIGLALDGLSGLVGFHLRLAHVSLYRSFAAIVGELDLTQKQASVLRLIHANPGVSQVDIGGVLGMDRASTMAVVDRLQDRGFLVRRRCVGDRRRQELYLTEAGERVLAQVKRAVAEHEASFADRFTKAEWAAFLDGLRRIHGQPV
jgi:DNA-binding MarR family transcriptional regulator